MAHISRSETLKELRTAVEGRLEISPEEGRQWRAAIKQCAADIATQQAAHDSSSDTGSGGSSDSDSSQTPVGGKKRGRSSSAAASGAHPVKPAPKKRSTAKSTAERQARALTTYMRAARIGPHVFSQVDAARGTPQYVRELSAAIKGTCDTPPFKGRVPTQAEIKAEQQRQATLQELEGLDTANVLGSAQRRRRRAPPPLPGRLSDAGTSDGSSFSDSDGASSDEVEAPAPAAAAAAAAAGAASDVFDDESDSD